jgi:hypothetical protein
MLKLEYDEEQQDYFVQGYLAAVIVGSKALLQAKEGRKFKCAILGNGRITEVGTGSVTTLSGAKWRASASSGWVEE